MRLTDARIAEMFLEAQAIERDARAALETEDLAERDDAVIALRHVTALRRSVEGWIARRATVSHLRAGQAAASR